MATAETIQATTLPKSTFSSSFHRRFPTVTDYVQKLGGSESRVIEKILIANNGVAAVKAIRSIRRWAYEVFGNERAISFVVMATPEDLRANAEYIRMGDVIVDVPGGSNNHNYANVTLIVELARLHGVHAVWAGWGHASENPVLPDTLAKSDPPIKFIGPSGPPMRALGDKIGSTIIAQSAGVSCIAWNGQDVKAEYDKETGSLPDEAYKNACIHSVTEAVESARKIGFPVMIKASEGGGGKGIRKVDSLDNVPSAYRQVCGEVPGSPIFIMKLADQARHLEVQLLADEYGNAIALNGRDCSVQRRHQKIIEEGPPIAASPIVWKQMEKAAVSLAKAVGYANAGTVEYLYSEATGMFCFLELNPRLQVEHPVTEMITRVNLPACQLQVAMGIPLFRIPDVRELYNKNRFEEFNDLQTTFIDFDNVERIPPYGHCIAVRITAENAEAGFKPTSGGIQELNFRSTPNVWGYFSMDSSGSIHEFADSQFGHLFASGVDREQARRNMVLALKELSIRGDISTTVEYISKLIEMDDFISNRITTQWLDGIIRENVEGIGSAADGVRKSEINDHTSVAIGATIIAHNSCIGGEKQFLESLTKGQLPSLSLLTMSEDIELILNDVKYKLCWERSGATYYKIFVRGVKNKFIESSVRVLSDGGYLIALGGKSHVAYVTSKDDGSTGLRINVGGANVLFSADYDPSSLRTDVAGKFVKKLVSDGAYVKKGEPYAEIEVMKMFMPLKVEESGKINWQSNEGAALAAGDLLAYLELENPENVASFKNFEGDLEVEGWVKGDVQVSSINHSKPHQKFRDGTEKFRACISGYLVSTSELQQSMADITKAVSSPHLPIYEVEEQLAVLVGRIDATLFAEISQTINDFRKSCEDKNIEDKTSLRFPANKIEELISTYSNSLRDPSERTAFLSLVSALSNTLMPYINVKSVFLPGAERALILIIGLMREFISNERCFSAGVSYADAIVQLRKENKDDYSQVLKICRAHSQIKSSSQLMSMIFVTLSKHYLAKSAAEKSIILNNLPVFAADDSISSAASCLSEIGSMSGSETLIDIGLQARQILLRESLSSIAQRIEKLKMNVLSLVETGNSQANNANGKDLHFADVFFPVLNSFTDVSHELCLVELLARKLYRMHEVKETIQNNENRLLKIVFTSQTGENVLSTRSHVKSLTDLTRMLSRSNSMNRLVSGESDSDSELSQDGGEAQSPLTQRVGVYKIINSLKELSDGEAFKTMLKNFPKNEKSTTTSQSNPMNVLYIIVTEEKIQQDIEAMNSAAKEYENILSSWQEDLRKAGIRRVSFILGRNQFSEGNTEIDEYPMPACFTFRATLDYKEDSLFRNIEPSLAYLLDLNRLAKNFSVRSLGSKQSAAQHIHIYRATPKPEALTKDPNANKAARVFVRVLCFVSDLQGGIFERTFVDALNSLELAAKYKGSEGKVADNHLFLNFIGAREKVLDPVLMEQGVTTFLKRHNERMKKLGVNEVETRLVCRLNQDSPPIAIRMVASNPTGYVLVMNSYVEAADETNTKTIFKLIGGTKASLAGSGDSSWEGLQVTSPYPLTRPFDAQRKKALLSSDTLYCYDLPALFEAVIEEQWENKASSNLNSKTKMVYSKPMIVMHSTELVVQKKSTQSLSSWTIADYSNDDLNIIPVQRGAGANDVGMVVWLMVLHTVEYPEGREVIVIANDITFKAGSFGTREDVVFKLASEYAREKKIPRLYVAANSGARIGLAESVKEVYKVAFKDKFKPENGFDYIYVTETDYQKLAVVDKSIKAEQVSLEGEEVYKLTDIIGTEPDLGVENLKGSGLIAGETSAAYNEIFTLTIVLGRTVGIGAYLVRLGQRTIQKVNESPIILTGYQALNKLMGCEVYSTNDQLGGPGIMYSNGISHVVAQDHFQAIAEGIKWLSYVPSTRGGLLPITDIRGIDIVDREIDFCPAQGVPYDPRFLLCGKENDDGEWLSGFFDKDSFVEALSIWAKSVVVGRARLGGIPMGVIATENRSTEAVKPADPADVKASESVIQQAGCVWFPNSAYKTAQAINDFRTEDLPLIIFANWRGFSGGQRDMFEEVLKYGSLIVDAFVAFEQPVFVLIPPCAEVRGGAWVVLDPSINSSVMEMYACSTARGGVLEANGAASVKYRTKDLLKTMHRLDDKLKSLDIELETTIDTEKQKAIQSLIKEREQSLLPVYEQVSVQFCDLHDTPGRMKSVGVIEKEVDWANARIFFFWRLRRKLAEFDLRKKMQEAAEVGRGLKAISPIEASMMIKSWFLESTGMPDTMWNDDKAVLQWMAQNNEELENKVLELTVDCVTEEVYRVITAGGNTAKIGTRGVLKGLELAYKTMTTEQKAMFKKQICEMFN